MISQLEENDIGENGKGILSFDPHYLDWVQDNNTAFYNQQVPKQLRPWGFGKLYNSSEVTSLTSLATSLLPIVRTPGYYTEVSDQTGTAGDKQLNRPGECIHRCVRVRIDGGGLGQEEHSDQTKTNKLFDLAKKALHLTGVYNPEALKDFQCVESPQVKTETDHSAVSSGVVWRAKDGSGRELPEDTLGATEIRLLRRSINNARF
jgi:hypothetical protein